MATTTRTATDAQGTWTETLTDGVMTSRQLVTESAAYTSAREALRLAALADADTESTRAGQVQTALAGLDAGTTTLAEMRVIVARIIRYLNAHRTRT
jgi:hypothetical protein